MAAPLPLSRAQLDQASFEDFFSRTSQLVVGLVAVTTGDAAAAEDAVQEAYARAFARWQRVGSLDRPDMWVARVATRIAISSWRRRRRERPLDAATPQAVGDLVEAIWTRWGLAALSPRQRAAVVMHHVYGMRVDEVAAASDTSAETVRTHLRRGRRRLRSLLREDTDVERPD